jgi:hypothetical protein
MRCEVASTSFPFSFPFFFSSSSFGCGMMMGQALWAFVPLTYQTGPVQNKDPGKKNIFLSTYCT